MILSGDVGGTKTRIAVYSIEDGRPRRHQAETFSSRDYSSLEEILASFLEKYSLSVKKACLGVPGPVISGHVSTTNLPWKLSEKKIAEHLRIDSLKLVNDIVAIAAAVPHLQKEDLITIHRGAPEGEESVFGVLAPGTGFGQGFLCRVSGKNHVFASEGGHADFAPVQEIEVELLHYLKKKYGRVSYERILSGPGLVNITMFLRDRGFAGGPEGLKELLQEDDPAAIISQRGISGECEICSRALDIFASILGAEAGNMALRLLATGGVYLGGGIPPKISVKLLEGKTLQSYLDKGRLSYLVEKTPLHIIRDDCAALLGAASIAAEW
jgi:glucokinase